MADPTPTKKARTDEGVEDPWDKVTTTTLEAPEQLVFDDQVFPLVLTPKSPEAFPDAASMAAFATKHKAWVDTELLPKYGAVYWRGFPLPTPEDFSNFVDAFNWTHDSVVGGGGPRNTVVGKVKTSTETPAHLSIPLHHEVAYLKETPARLVFYCDVEPGAGGETPVVLSKVLLKNMTESNPDFVARIREKGIRYIRRIEDQATADTDQQRPWQAAYDTTDREEAETRARDTGTDTIEWDDKGAMIVRSQVFPGIKKSGVGADDETWFNVIALLHPASHKGSGKNAPWTVKYGDDTDIADEDVLSILEAMKKDVAATKWAKGDVLMVDNRVSLHSRNPFTPPRRILAAIIRE